MAASGVGMGYTGMATSGLAFNPSEAPSRPSDLRITDIRGCVLATHFPNPIIKIYTNQDLVGLGEVRDNGWLASALMMKPYLVGRNPLDIENILASVRHLSGHNRFGGGYSAVSIALMDLIGKALDEPCWKLLDLGEKQREEVPIYASFGRLRDTQRFSEIMKRRVEKGYQHYKLAMPSLRGEEGALSGGVPTRKGLEIWGEAIRHIRDTIGYEVSLGAYGLGDHTVKSAIEAGEFLAQAPFGIDYMQNVIDVERFDSVNMNRRVAEHSPTPNQMGSTIFGFGGFAPLIEAGAVDIVHPDMRTAGGMLEVKKIADYADRHGVQTLFHAAPSAVGFIADVHCAATIRAFKSLEYQYRWPYMPWWDDMVSGVPKPIIQPGGVVPVPDGPGLGITFNEEAAERYLMDPEYLPFDPGLFDPTPQFDEPMTMLEAKQKGLIDYDRDTSYSWWHLDENMEYGLKPRGT